MKFVTLNRKKIFLSIMCIGLIYFGYLALGFGRSILMGSVSVGEGNVQDGTFRESLSLETVGSGEVEELGDLPEILVDDWAKSTTRKAEPGEDGEYFVNYRMEREKIRGQLSEALESIIGNPHSTDAARTMAQDKIMQLSENMETELELESLIKAKAYEDAIVLLREDSVMVVIKAIDLKEEDEVKVTNLVAHATGLNYENIYITYKE